MFFSTTRIAIAIALLLTPISAAAGMLQAQDSVAGVGIDIALSSFTPQSNIEVQFVSPDNTPNAFAVRMDAQGNGTLAIAGRFAELAGTYVLTVPADTTAHTTVTVAPDSMDPRISALQVKTPRIAADGMETADITVILRDRFGNPLPGRATNVLAGRTTDTLRVLTPETDAKGMQYFSLTTKTPGQTTLRAIDLLSGTVIAESAVIDAQSLVAVGGQTANINNGRFFYAQTLPSFDIVDHFTVDAPDSMQPGVEAQKLTIRAVDRAGQTVENYLGTVLFSSTDSDATLPNFGTYTFRERDLGEKSFALSLKFRTGGPQTFRIEDANDNRISGEVTIQVGSSGTLDPGTGTIEITSHTQDGFINSADIVIEGRGPRFTNIIVMGGPQDAKGVTDENGFFSVPVALSPQQLDHTIRVRDESGRNDSGPIHLVLDQSKKEIEAVQFAPEKPDAGAQVLVIVKSAPALTQVMMRLPADGTVQEVILAENPTQPGTYQTFFTAPVAGTYQPSIVATDQAGNLTELRTILTVTSTVLPRIENLSIEPRVESIALRWEVVTGQITGYRIYIGDGPDNFLYTLDTSGPVTQAVVRGLLPGQLYYFAVTALRDALESEEKSEVLTGQPLGITLTVTPGESSLTVQWTSLAADLPLSSFLLEYGADANALTEQRQLNGELRDITIHDLLPGISYALRLTPISVTGEALTQLAATGKGTPGGAGFHPAPRDDAPFDVSLHPGATLNPPPAVNAVGLPRSAWITIASFGALTILWFVRRRQSAQRMNAFLQAVASRTTS